MGRRVAYAAVGFQTWRQDCESAGREADGDRDRANHRQPQQPDLPPVELPGLLEGIGAQPRAVQDRGRSAGRRLQEGAQLSVKRSRYLYRRAYMGTDWLQLFDKSLSDKILAMNRQRLVRF